MMSAIAPRMPPPAPGLGFRRDLLPELGAGVPEVIRFFELAPENWLRMGGRSARELRAFTERFPFVAHGLSLSLGGQQPLNVELLDAVAEFKKLHGIALYTEHLSWCADEGMLYELLPLPYSDEAVRHVAARIAQVQDRLGERIAVENASCYLVPPGSCMSEAEFVCAVLEEADCWLHLDVNNVYVNSVNHCFDPREFIQAMPAQRVVYMHMAGHYRQAPDLLIDTHGAAVINPVFELLDLALAHCGPTPVLLERDYNIPPLAELCAELSRIAGALAACRVRQLDGQAA